MKLIKQKKSQFYKKRLKENIGKPNKRWKALKSLGLPSKKGTTSNICLKKDDKICFDDKANANVFKKFFCKLASDLVAKLLPSSNRFGLDTVRNYYHKESVPLVKGALGSVSKLFKTNIDVIGIPNIICSAQISTITSIARILRDLLSL